MLYREVGTTGVRLSEVGFGCGGNAGLMVSGTREQQREAIKRALELGINYFDNSGHYGDGASETNLGIVLKELRARPYVTTKVEVRSHNLSDIAGHVMRSVDESLERLGLDSVDFLQIHNGPVLQRPTLEGDSYATLWIEDFLRPGGALEGLQHAQEAGKTRFIGFITRGNDTEAAQRLIDTGCFHLINVSVNLLNPSASIRPQAIQLSADFGGILNYAADHGVGAAIYSPLAGGMLTDNTLHDGPPHPLAAGPVVHRAIVNGEEVVRTRVRGTDVARARAKSFGFLSRPGEHNLAEAGIRFNLSLKGVTTVLGGFSDREQVDELAGCSDKGPLSSENMDRIEAVWRANFGQGAEAH